MRGILLALVLLLVNHAAWAADSEPVFRQVLRRAGDDGVKSYRIPALATTTKGTLLAAFDIRHNGAHDLPADIDVGVMRSTDNGETWSAMQRVLDFDKDAANARGNGVGDPTILVDQQTGVIFIAALWSQGDRAFHGSGPGLEPAESGQFVLTKSTDDGLTWSQPINITRQVKDPKWRICFQGPGAGIQCKDGTLIFPAQYREATGLSHACFIFSRDHGDTWHISPPAIAEKTPTTEAQIAELKEGSLLLTMRDESQSGERLWARWEWNEKDPQQGTWSKSWRALPDPTCMASLLRHPHGELLFANPAHAKQRKALTVRASRDEGKTWNAGRVLEPGGSMYSCLCVLKNGDVGIFYEAGNTMTFARFPLSWITDAP